jgi:transposase
VFHQPLRQTEGLLRSNAALLDIDIAIPDHTTLSRRGGGLTILPKSIHRDEPLHLLLDSTGLTIYGESEWLDQPRVAFVPLGVGANCISALMPACMKIAVELTQDDVGDVSEIVALLDQVASPVASVIADGAYDGETIYDAVTDRHPETDIIIPPRATAVPSTSGAPQRNQHIASIEKHGRIGWQRRSGYNRRSLVETAMYRYKTIIGRRLLTRTLSSQQREAKIGCNALNRMTSFGMPATIRIG